MSENAIVSKIEIDGSHNIVFLSVKDVPGIESIIEEVQKYVTMHIEKYTKMSANCESKGAFAAGMIGASFYKNYKTAYLVLCIPKVEGEVATGHQIYTKDNRWFDIDKSSYAGYYADTTAAIADGMSHYWPGNSSTSLISNLSPNQTTGSPVVNNTSGSYDSSFPYFDFYTGNANENGYRYTQTTTKWGNGPFTIAFWVQVMATTVEGESTFVQLGDHPSGVLRCLYSVSTDQNRQLKAITIGDDVSANNQAVFPTSWTHFVNTYSGSGTNQTKYYINGSLARTHTHSGNLDVGTGTKYIYIGSGYWNSDATNKASMSHMSDIGIWNAKELSASEIANLYNAKRTIAGS